MTFDHLSHIFQAWGYVIKQQHYQNFKDYLSKMLEMDRVLVVCDQNGVILSILTFYLTKNFEKIYKKGTWDITQDDPSGQQIYIDKMVAREWSPSIRKAVESAFTEKFPDLTEGIYHRAPYDRCVVIYRRGVLV